MFTDSNRPGKTGFPFSVIALKPKARVTKIQLVLHRYFKYFKDNSSTEFLYNSTEVMKLSIPSTGASVADAAC